MALLEINNIEVYYGVIKALKGVSLEVNEGEIVALIGANGAGKSTTMKAVMGLIKVKEGSITYNSKRIDKLKTHEIVKMGLTLVPEGRRIFQELTVYENLRYYIKACLFDYDFKGNKGSHEFDNLTNEEIYNKLIELGDTDIPNVNNRIRLIKSNFG